jgi:hypothetical protein
VTMPDQLSSGLCVVLLGGVPVDVDYLDIWHLDASERKRVGKRDHLGLLELIGTGRDVELDAPEGFAGEVTDDLRARGYEVTTEVPTTEYFGGMQALLIDRDAGAVRGVADERRIGAWDAASR